MEIHPEIIFSSCSYYFTMGEMWIVLFSSVLSLVSSITRKLFFYFSNHWFPSFLSSAYWLLFNYGKNEHLFSSQISLLWETLYLVWFPCLWQILYLFSFLIMWIFCFGLISPIFVSWHMIVNTILDIFETLFCHNLL